VDLSLDRPSRRRVAEEHRHGPVRPGLPGTLADASVLGIEHAIVGHDGT
jgi:hypothetical protein